MPFSVEQFLEVFAAYNRGVWPAQLVLYAIGLGIVAAVLLGGAARPKIAIAGLAALWAWAGGVYHLGYFVDINPAAGVFGAAFLAQAALFPLWLVRRRSLDFRFSRDFAGVVGASLLAYALVVYPVLNVLGGHAYPAMPTFGAPCPVTIATFGLMACATPRPPWWTWLVPLLWAAVGTSAAIVLGVREDLGLPVAAVLALAARSLRRGAAGVPG